MKILQLVPYFFPYNGGQERYVYNLSKYLIKMGHEVHIITSNYPKSKRYDIIDGISVERYTCLFRPLRNPITPGLLGIRKKIKKYDIVHTHNEHSFAAMVAAYFRKKTNIPLILTCHGQLRFGNNLADQFERVYSRMIGKKILNSADSIVTLSDSDADYVSSFNIDRDKICVLPNAIDTKALSTRDNDGDNIVENYKLKETTILFVGPVIQRKGVQYLLKSILNLSREEHREVTFLIVGDGDYLEKAKSFVAKYKLKRFVRFTGRVSQEELLHYYKAADIFVLPSLSEGLPTTILEAMYFDLPVVATDIPGVKDHFKDVAILVPPRDEKSLTEAIIKLIDAPNLRRKLSRRGKELIVHRYIWKKVAEKYEELYENLIG